MSVTPAALTPAERAKEMLRKANRGVNIAGAYEPSALSLLKRAAAPEHDGQAAMSIEFKISTSDATRDWAKKLLGNADLPVLEEGKGQAAYVAKRTKSVELTTNATTTISERAMLSAGKAISWIEASGGDADEYERWVRNTWGEAFEDAMTSYKLLLTDGWEKEVMMEADKPESASYALHNYMPMVKAEFNNFPKSYFGKDAYVPWHKYAVALKAIGAINIAASQHRDKLHSLRGKSLWFVPTMITGRTMSIDYFKLDTSAFAKYEVALPQAVKGTDRERVRDLSDWTFHESLSILRKNLRMDEVDPEDKDVEWVDALIQNALSIRKRRVLLERRSHRRTPDKWEDISSEGDPFATTSLVAVNVYERKFALSDHAHNPYSLAVRDMQASVGAVYRVLRDKDDLVAGAGRYIKDVFKSTGHEPLYSFLHKDSQNAVVKVVSSGLRSSRCDMKYVYSYLSSHGVLPERHRILSDMVRHAFGYSSFSFEMLGIIRHEESIGVHLDMVNPVLDLRPLRIQENQAPKKRYAIVLSALKDSVDARFERHYRARLRVIEEKYKLSENTKARINHKRYRFLLKYHKFWTASVTELTPSIDWNRIGPLLQETFIKFLRKSKVEVVNGITEEDIRNSTPDFVFNQANTIDAEHRPEFQFVTAIRILEQEIERKGDDLKAVKKSIEAETYDEEVHLAEAIPPESVEQFDEFESLRRKAEEEESRKAMEAYEIDPYILALMGEQEDIPRDRPLRTRLEDVIAEKGYAKNDVRLALGILDWNDVLSQYEIGELTINDIEVAIRNQKLASTIAADKVLDVGDFVADF